MSPEKGTTETTPVTPGFEVIQKPFCSRYGFVLRSLSAILVFTFLAQDFAQAQGGTPLWSHVIETKNSSTAKVSGMDKVTIPAEAGLTRKISVKGTNDLIINIQDAHSKLGAQESISKILDSLVKNYNLSLITLEGATDVVDTSIVSSFPLEEARRKAANFLLKEGKISAGEFFSMVTNDPVKLYGVDDAVLYKENVEVFKNLIENKAAIRTELKNLKKAVDGLEKKVYSPALFDMSNKKLLHKAGDIKFTEYWAYFSKLAQEKNVEVALIEGKGHLLSAFPRARVPASYATPVVVTRYLSAA